jgi:hypothetical protein
MGRQVSSNITFSQADAMYYRIDQIQSTGLVWIVLKDGNQVIDSKPILTK